MRSWTSDPEPGPTRPVDSASDPSGSGSRSRRLRRLRLRRRQRRWAGLVVLLIAAALAGSQQAGRILVLVGLRQPTGVAVLTDGRAGAGPATGAAGAAPIRTGTGDPDEEIPALPVTPVPPASNQPVPPAPAPLTGPGTFRYAAQAGPVLGRAGVPHRFHVAVERDVGQEPVPFAARVDTILGDPRSWIASGGLRLQRVPPSVRAEFTIFLATPATSEQMCAAGGLATERYTSCRLPGQVIINLQRWLTAVPGYGAPLAVYQAYAINHEVGHQLGYGHEACPGPGRPAPVMQQQTYGLKGCTANAWPYLDGRRYGGAEIP